MPTGANLRSVAAAALFALVVYHCFFTGLDSMGFVGPDEPRYASIAREMARSGDWVTPRLNGTPWFEKPPLYYWSAAIGFRTFASPEVAARVPSGIFAVFAVLGVALLALRVYGEATARALTWMLTASVGMIGFARAAATDMPFAACLVLAMCAVGCLVLEDEPKHKSALSAAFGAALGLAVLAKGPAAVVLTGGSTAIWAVAGGNVRRSFRLFHPIAIGTFLLVALPWYVLCAMRNPEFLRIFLLENNVERFLTNRYQHGQPFWFFGPIILLAVFPWTLLIIPAISDGWRALREAEWRRAPGVYLSSWVLFPFLFFSASQSKLPGYILPAVPALVLLLARALTCGNRGLTPFLRDRLHWVAAALVVGGIAAVFRAENFPDSPEINQPLSTVGIALICGGGVAVGLSAWLILRRSAAAAAVAVAFAAGLVANHVLPAMDLYVSPRILARQAKGPLPALETYHIPRAWQYGLEFYLEHTLPEWASGPPPPWIITDEKGRAELTARGWQLERSEPSSRHAALYHIQNARH